MRDRKRRDTYRRIHDAAVELTSQAGLQSATVSDIAERAGVSRRTFFNYYATKEDAVLGITPPAVPAGALDAYLRPPAGDEAGTDRFGQAMRLTLTTMTAAGVRPKPSPAVHKLLATHPELVDRLKAHHLQIQDLLVQVLDERLASAEAQRDEALPDGAQPSAGTADLPPPGDGVPPRPSRSDSARALILLAAAVLRFAQGSDPDFLDNPTPAAIDSALAAFRTAVRELA